MEELLSFDYTGIKQGASNRVLTFCGGVRAMRELLTFQRNSERSEREIAECPVTFGEFIKTYEKGVVLALLINNLKAVMAINALIMQQDAELCVANSIFKNKDARYLSVFKLFNFFVELVEVDFYKQAIPSKVLTPFKEYVKKSLTERGRRESEQDTNKAENEHREQEQKIAEECELLAQLGYKDVKAIQEMICNNKLYVYWDKGQIKALTKHLSIDQQEGIINDAICLIRKDKDKMQAICHRYQLQPERIEEVLNGAREMWKQTISTCATGKQHGTRNPKWYFFRAADVIRYFEENCIPGYVGKLLNP